EGYAGSAVQASLLGEDPSAEGPTLLFVHGVNPYGMKFYRRANGQNVDLNRNYRKGAARPNPDYALFDAFLHPADGSNLRAEKIRAILKAVKIGWGRAAQAIASGQVTHPKGLFFMGHHVQREIQVVQDILRSHCGEATEVVALDFHTGLGRYGQEQLFVDRDADPDAENFVRKVFHRPAEPAANNYVAQGRFSDSLRDALPGAKLRYVLQELGALSPLKTIEALRQENFEWQRRPAGRPRPLEIEQSMMNAFCPKEEKWRRNGHRLGCERWRQAEKFLRDLP
ncbi:MAG: DUF2817 domain-containing protein, partial [Proteobacteria bacterium]